MTSIVFFEIKNYVSRCYPGGSIFTGDLGQLYSGYNSLRLLAKGATIEDIKIYAEKAIASDNERIKENAGTVIDVCLAVNKNLEEDKEMYEAVREVFKDAFAKERQEGRQEGTKKANERVAVEMLKDGKPINEITRYSQLAENVIRNIATSMGLAIS